MKRLTTETPKDNLEAELNLFYIKDHETWVRGCGPAPEYADVSLFDLTRDIVKTHIPDAELPADNDDLSNMMPEWLMDGIDSAEGVVALLYTAAWAYAELRHKLMKHEDFMERWNLRSVEEADRIFQRINDLGGTDLMVQYRELGPIEHLRELIQAEQNGKLVVLPFQQGKTLIDRTFPENPQLMENVRVAVAYDSSGIIFHYPFNDFIQNVESGCIFQVSGETETMLAGKDSMQSDAPKETAEPEWKNRVMRTFLGGRGT